MDNKLSVNAKYDDDGEYESTPGSPNDQDSSARSSVNGKIFPFLSKYFIFLLLNFPDACLISKY